MITASKQYGLQPEEVAFYHENGYLHLPGVLAPEEAAYLREEAHALIRRLMTAWDDEQAVQARWGSAQLITEMPISLLHCHNVQFHSAAFTRLICDPRLTDRIADLIGPNIQLHHTKLFIKPPERGAPFPLHQDYPYFPHEKHTMLAAVFFFDDAPPEKGCLCVVPGSHRLGPLPLTPKAAGTCRLSSTRWRWQSPSPRTQVMWWCSTTLPFTAPGSTARRSHAPPCWFRCATRLTTQRRRFTCRAGRA